MSVDKSISELNAILQKRQMASPSTKFLDLIKYEAKTPSTSTSTILAQVQRSEMPDFVHEEVVDDYEFQHDEEMLLSLNDDGTVAASTITNSVGSSEIKFQRSSESAVLCSVLLAGDRGSGKTTLTAALSSGDIHVLQALRYHTSSFYNFWIDPTEDDIGNFRRELEGAASVTRQLPFFPSQMCVGSLNMDPSELAYFLDDEEIKGLTATNEIAASQDITDSVEGVSACVESFLQGSVNAEQHATLRIMEAGGDLIESMMKAEESMRSKEASCPSSSVTEEMLHLVVRNHIGLAAWSIGYFVNSPVTLASENGLAETIEKINFLVRCCGVQQASGAEGSVAGKVKVSVMFIGASTMPLDAIESALGSIRDSVGEVAVVRGFAVDHVDPATGAFDYTQALGTLHHLASHGMHFGDESDEFIAAVAQRILLAAASSNVTVITRKVLGALLFDHGHHHHHHSDGEQSTEAVPVRNMAELWGCMTTIPPMVAYDNFAQAAVWLVKRGFATFLSAPSSSSDVIGVQLKGSDTTTILRAVMGL